MIRLIRVRGVDAVVVAVLLGILIGLWWSAQQGFDAAAMAAGACRARELPSGLAACFATAPWLHLSAAHGLLNLAAVTVLWRHLRSGNSSEVVVTGVAGSLFGMLASSLLFGVPVAGASALVHGWLGRCFVRHPAPLSAFDLLAVSALLALGGTAPTWVGHLVAALAGAAAAQLLATNRAPR